MNNLIIAPFFFFLGALVSWLFRSKVMDRQDNILHNHIKFLEAENKSIRAISRETTDFMEPSIWERDRQIYLLQEIQQQEKQEKTEG